MKVKRWFFSGLFGLIILMAGFLCTPVSGLAAFHNNGNGTVSDSVTELMWQRSDDGISRTWQGAIDHCEALTLPSGGYSDWRLPGLQELESLIDQDYVPTIDPEFFPNCGSSFYWSSTPTLISIYAWGVHFDNGYLGDAYKPYSFSVRCVRTGPGGSDTTPPAPITNLSATTGTLSGNVTLTWTAPGDDGAEGTADHYEVKYHSESITSANWDQATTYTQNWSPEAGGGAESRTVERLTPGQTYYFAVKGVDKAGNKGDVSNSPSAVSGSDFLAEVMALEVTQAIQDLKNSVELIEGKKTVVRAHLKRTAGTTSSKFSAKLYGFASDGSSLPMSPLKPVEEVLIKEAPSRKSFEDSFWFDLPKSWAKGTIDLDFQSEGFDLSCNEKDGTGDCKQQATFYSTPSPEVIFVGVKYKWDGTWYEPNEDDLLDAAERIESNTPIPELIRTYAASPIELEEKPTKTIHQKDIIGKLEFRRLLYFLFRPPNPNLYFGAVIKGSFHGVTSAGGAIIGMNQFSGYLRFDDTKDYDDTFLAHEFAHCLGRNHTRFKGVCRQAPCDNNYSPRLGTIGETAHQFDEWNSACVFGTDLKNRSMMPEETADVMTYEPKRWVSPYTYLKMREALINAQSANELSNYRKMEAKDAASLKDVSSKKAAIIVGRNNSLENSAVISHFVIIDYEGTIQLPIEGPYEILFKDGQGEILNRYPFSPDRFAAEGSSEEESVFGLVLPWDINTREVELIETASPSTSLTSFKASNNPPSVTVNYPNGGESLTDGKMTLRWTAGDVDGNSLKFIVQYSADGGQTWETLVTDLQESSLEIHVDALNGSTQALIRILATDGFYTSQDQSNGFFTVANHSPRTTIVSPETGSSFTYNQGFVLRGRAYDREDGRLGDAALKWSSNIDGQLGSGRSLYINTSLLTEGNHTITLTATDSNGNSGTAAITVGISSTPVPRPVAIGLAPVYMRFVAEKDGNQPPFQVLAIRNAGDGTLEWQASDDKTWIFISDNSGTAPSNVSITVDPSGLAPGTYNGTVSVLADAASNTPQSIQVVLMIEATGTLQFKSSSYSVDEDGGKVRIYVSRTGGSWGDASVSYSATDGTAKVSDGDYASSLGQLEWGEWDAEDKYFDININNDEIPEDTEKFTANLTDATGAELGNPTQATIEIAGPNDQQKPSVSTAAVSGITFTSAISGGTVTSEGSAGVTVRGLCWSTSTDPTTDDTKTEDGTGTGEFTGILKGLTPETRYYVRAYATNQVGTAYGENLLFTTDKKLIPAPGGLPDTGQTLSYTDTFGEDSDYLINPPSYTKLDAGGNDLPDSAAEWVMVRDNVTGLIWEVKQAKDDVASYGNPHDADNKYTWYDSNPDTNGGNAGTPGDGTDTEDFINSLNAEKFGGQTNWRMPTIKEQESIWNRGNYNPPIDGDYFPDTVSSLYWSSTTDASNSSFALGSGYWDSKSYRKSVRAVRGGQSGSLGHFIINGDKTVTDTLTGLMWQQEIPEIIYDWRSALAYCAGLSLAVFDDWRLPNHRELASIVDYSVYGPAIDELFFPGTKRSYYWSSTTVAGTNFASVVSFNDGTVGLGIGKEGNGFVRAVRGGQPRLLGHLAILAPGQASFWNAEDIMTIKWDTQNIPGNVSISISRQGGKTGTFETIVSSIENDESYDWTVTGPGSVNCMLKIEPLSDLDKGTVQGLFSINAATLPTVSTASASDITLNSAKSGGDVTSDGGATVTGRGICRSTSAKPTVSDHPIPSGSGTGSFSSSITSLTPGTTYYVRAYATNSSGIGYGDDLSFTTSYSSTLNVCGQEPCYKTIQSALDAAENGSLIKVADGTYSEAPDWKKAGIVTLSGGWKNSFTEHNGVSEIYNPLASGGGSVKLQPNFKVVPQ